MRLCRFRDAHGRSKQPIRDLKRDVTCIPCSVLPCLTVLVHPLHQGFVCSRTMRRLRSAWVVSGASIREQIKRSGFVCQEIFLNFVEKCCCKIFLLWYKETMKANLNIIEQKRKAIGISTSELARRVGGERETLSSFLKSGKQLNKDLRLITILCKELKVDIKDVIKWANT